MRQHATRAAQSTCRPCRSSARARVSGARTGEFHPTKKPRRRRPPGLSMHVNAFERYLGGEATPCSSLETVPYARSAGAGPNAGLKTFQFKCRCALLMRFSATTRRAQRRGEGGEIYITKKRSQSKNRQKNSGIWRGSEVRQSHVKRRRGGRTARASTGGHHPRYNPQQRGDGEHADEDP